MNLMFTAKKPQKQQHRQMQLCFRQPLKKTQFLPCYLNLTSCRSFLREEAEKLPECIRLINKTTSQYITELDYEAAAVKEEADAKIRAQEELVNPQIAKLNKDYKAQNKGFNGKL